MLGHNNIKITQSTYAQVSTGKIFNDMKDLIKPESLIFKPSEHDLKKYSK
jgi:hypothetical protein